MDDALDPVEDFAHRIGLETTIRDQSLARRRVLYRQAKAAGLNVPALNKAIRRQRDGKAPGLSLREHYDLALAGQ